DEWRQAAVASLADQSLSVEERHLAVALDLFAQQRFPESCQRFRSIAQLDSSSFAAWFGLGDCQANDHVVIRDRSNRRAWQFRSSYHAAAQAYLRAFAILPSAHRAPSELLLTRLNAVLVTRTGHYRPGWSGAPDSIAFASFPTLDA